MYSPPGRRLVFHEAYSEAPPPLVSPARGPWLFSPIAVLAAVGLWVRRRQRRLDLLDLVVAGSVVAQLLVVSASREAWWAGDSFGPRFMSDVVPFVAYLAVPAVDRLADMKPRNAARLAVAGALVWGVAVNAQGAYLRAAN